MAKHAIIVLGGAVILILGGLLIHTGATLSGAREDLQTVGRKLEEERSDYKHELTQAQLGLKARNERIEALQQKERDFDRAQEELKSLQESASKAQAQSDAERAKAGGLAAQVESLRAERDRLQRELEAQLTVHAEVAPQLAAAKQAAESSAAELDKVKKEKAAVAERLAVAEAEAKKYAEEIDKIRRLAPETEIVGKVQEKVTPDNIILCELSEKPEVGLEVSIFRDAEFIARARVFRAYDKLAGARLTFVQKGRDVAPGDVVRTKFQSPVEQPSPR